MTAPSIREATGPAGQEPTSEGASLESFNIPATPLTRGSGHGKVFHAAIEMPIVTRCSVEDVEAEAERYEQARTTVERRYRDLMLNLESGSEAHSIVRLHHGTLELPEFKDSILESIRSRRLCAEAVLFDAIDPSITAIRRMPFGPTRTKAADFLQITRDLLFELDPSLASQGPKAHFLAETGKRVVVGDEIPLELMTDPVCREKVAGLSSLHDGGSSHATILANSLGIPMVTGVDPAKIPVGSYALVSAARGSVCVNPSEEVIRRFEEEASMLSHQAKVAHLKEERPVTADGVKLTFLANVVDPSQAREVAASGAAGVGLFRTEFMMMRDGHFLPLEAQVESYRRLIKDMAPDPVVIRTFDYGRDKVFTSSRQGAQGSHGLELALTTLQEEFFTQIKAVVSAAFQAGDVKILLPTVTGVGQVRDVKKLIDQCIKEEMDSRPGGRIPKIELGAMIENPAALLGIDAIAEIVDFLSVGTNDLTRTLLDNDRSTDGYRPTHPAVVKALIMIAEAADRAGKPVAVCGAMADTTEMIPLLIGAGFTRFSGSPTKLAELNYVARLCNREECKSAVERMADQSHTVLTNNQILRQLHESMESRGS